MISLSIKTLFVAIDMGKKSTLAAFAMSTLSSPLKRSFFRPVQTSIFIRRNGTDVATEYQYLATAVTRYVNAMFNFVRSWRQLPVVENVKYREISRRAFRQSDIRTAVQKVLLCALISGKEGAYGPAVRKTLFDVASPLYHCIQLDEPATRKFSHSATATSVRKL